MNLMLSLSLQTSPRNRGKQFSSLLYSTSETLNMTQRNVTPRMVSNIMTTNKLYGPS